MDKTPAVRAIPVADLIPYARNSRTHDEAQIAQLASSLDEFGMVGAIVVRDGVIAKGHGTLAAIRKLYAAGKALYPAPGKAAGADPYPPGTAPVLEVNGWTDAQFRAYVIADNKLAMNAGWDEEMLRVEFDALKDDGFDLALVGFDADELKDLFADDADTSGSSAAGGIGDEDESPPPPADPVTNPGDVWILGPHRVVCGDATSPTDWDKLQIKRPAMVFSSPPYGVGGNAKLRDKYKRGAEQRKSLYATHEDNPDEWPELMRGWTNNALARTDCIVCNIQTLANNKRNLVAWSAEYVDHMVDIAIWDKGHGAPQMQRNVLTNSFEWLFILAPEECPSRALPLADFHGTEENIVRVGKGAREFADVHRATMPVELAEWAVVSVGQKAAVVVDPFGGTGTTLIAAEKHGKAAALIELDARYVDVIVKRWQEFTGQVAKLEGDGRSFGEVASSRTRQDEVTA